MRKGALLNAAAMALVFSLYWGAAAADDGGGVVTPAGWFFMGCVPGDEACDLDESPRKKFFIDAFAMDKHEVTVGEYAQCVKAGQCEKPRDKSDSRFCNWGYPDKDSYPVNCVNWNQAQGYCRWKGKRLPTEAEWEKAARKGSEESIYPWGNEKADCTRAVMDRGNSQNSSKDSDGCGKNGTWEICAKGPGAGGLCDMAGNVREWCRDRYDPQFFSFTPPSNPVKIGRNGDCSLRGGSWLQDAESLRSSARSHETPEAQPIDAGFRCVKSLSGNKLPTIDPASPQGDSD